MFILLPQFVNSQWISCGTGFDDAARTMVYDSSSNKLYVGGNFHHAGGVPANQIAVWDGSHWDSLGDGFRFGAPVYKIFMYHDTLFASSLYYNLAPIDVYKWLNYWNGAVWDTFPQSADGPVDAATEYQGDLYLGGMFTNVGSVSANYVCKYSNGVIYPYNLPASSYSVSAIEFYQNNMYVAGNFYDSITNTNDLSVWDGTQFQRVGGYSFPFGSSTINSLITYNNQLFIGGYFNTPYGSNLIKWDGQNFSDAGLGIDFDVWKMKIFQGELYVCGGFTQIGGIAASGIARWDGTQWSPVVPFFYNTLISDFIFTPQGLYLVGGNFYIPGVSTNGIVLFTGLVGIEENASKPSISIFPNPVGDIVTIKYELQNWNIGIIEINDMLGRKLKSVELSEHESICQINVSDLNSGIYVTTLFSNENKIVQRFIKH